MLELDELEVDEADRYSELLPRPEGRGLLASSFAILQVKGTDGVDR